MTSLGQHAAAGTFSLVPVTTTEEPSTDALSDELPMA